MLSTQATIHANIHKVWEYWTTPHHIMQWNQASPDWHTPKAEVDLQVGGKFSSIMAAKDGSMSFDFWGIYTFIDKPFILHSTLGDDRKVEVEFASIHKNQTFLIQKFEAENENTEELQQNGWQAILDSFKNYVENN
jgi:uncharacterized protein YndB with AHSA1/START domain